MSVFQDNLRRTLANRHSPEAAALFQTLLEAVHKRVAYLVATRCRGALGTTDIEEILGEVLYQLMEGALARFRGESLPELLGFVRTITDRTTWRAAQRKARERRVVEQVHDDSDARWTGQPEAAPDRLVEFTPPSPLPEADQNYLLALLRAGSKAALAEHDGVSRAAVTQRIQRIRARIDALPSKQRASHEAWMERQARGVLDEEAPGELRVN
jgi:hypothetical protein